MKSETTTIYQIHYDNDGETYIYDGPYRYWSYNNSLATARNLIDQGYKNIKLVTVETTTTTEKVYPFDATLCKLWAKKLTGRQYGEEVTGIEDAELARNGLVVVYGASDDLTEFRGAISDEVSTWEGGLINFTKTGLDYDDYAGEYKGINEIEAVWCSNEEDPELAKYAWHYRTEIPHETFEIFEDGDPYCLGIIFSINNLR